MAFMTCDDHVNGGGCLLLHFDLISSVTSYFVLASLASLLPLEHTGYSPVHRNLCHLLFPEPLSTPASPYSPDLPSILLKQKTSLYLWGSSRKPLSPYLDLFSLSHPIHHLTPDSYTPASVCFLHLGPESKYRETGKYYLLLFPQCLAL